ncbi:unnamed protein product [Mytilus coruscus]|uniref:Uncharacterized protein n=1 Tax=Mytilus coruscus TaxID=42192 RepID=A0A6J8CXY8_MYTCO|nr:unnamed protein product [Mytilus coruscus]
MIWISILVCTLTCTCCTATFSENILPDAKNTTITWSLAEITLVNVAFHCVYPMPKCELFHNKSLLSTTYRSDHQIVDIVYNASISVISNSKICGGDIELICTLMTLSISVGSKHVLPACSEKHSELQTFNCMHVLVALCIAVAGCIATCIGAE